MKRTITLTLTALAFAWLVLPVASSQRARAQSAAAPLQTPAADPRFGAVESFWAPEEAAELGVGWERILFYWYEIQPTGPEDWNTLHVMEEWLHEANAHGRTVVGVLKNTPEWATDYRPPASGVPRGLELPVNDPDNLWANYVRRVATYYSRLGVHHWIVWNEPDIAPQVYGHEFSGTMEEYYRLLKVAYLVMKEVDPEASVHLGGMTYWHDKEFLQRFLRLVTADPEAPANNYFFDAISLHIYFRPESIPIIVGNVYAVQDEAGIRPAKRVWINETNARPSMDPEWPVVVQQFHLDLDQQAWYIPQAFALGFASGVDRISVYKLIDVNMALGDESWGLVRPYDFSRRPAFYAYKTTIEFLAGFTGPARWQENETYHVVRFVRPQGVTRVLWARTAAPVTVEIPAIEASALLVSATGESRQRLTAVNGRYTIELEGARCRGECLIGGPPLFLVEGEEVAPAPPSSARRSEPAAAAPAAADVARPAAATIPPPVIPTAAATATQPAPPSPTVPPATAVPILTPAAAGSAGLAEQAGLWFLGVGMSLALALAVLARARRNR
jgi:hypothetical protein